MSTEGFPINEAGARKTDFASSKIIYIFLSYPNITAKIVFYFISTTLFIKYTNNIQRSKERKHLSCKNSHFTLCIEHLHCQSEKEQDCFL